MGNDLKKLLPALVVMSLCVYALGYGVIHWANLGTEPTVSGSWEVVAGPGRGDRIQLEQLRPSVVVLDFWASWCGPCRLTTPIMQALYEHYPHGDVLVYGVNTESRPVGEIPALHEEFGGHYPSLHDPDQRLREAFSIENLPGLVIIGPNGDVAHQQEGRPDLDALVLIIEGLLH